MGKSGAKGRLSERQNRFVEEYLLDLNATAAAVRAGYTPKSAAKAGHRLKAHPLVGDRIERAMAARRRRTRIDQDRVVEELARIAFADIRQFVTWDGEGVTLRASAELTPEQTACVAEIVETAGKGLRIKLHSKQQALSALARHLGGDKAGETKPARPVITVVSQAPEPAPPLAEAGPEGGRESSRA